MLGPRAKISLSFVKSPFFSKFISKISNDNPSPAAKSAKPPRSASDKSFTTAGAFIILNSSIINLDVDKFFSITDQ